MTDLPINGKVCPEVCDLVGDVPVLVAELVHSGGEEVEHLVPVGHAGLNRRLLVLK